MADTFFGFEASLNNGDNLLPDDDDCVENEEEYDALNDETFGGLEDSDWEQQHEQFAEIAESSKHSEEIENSITKLVLEDDSPILSKSSVWAYTPPNSNGDIFNSSILSSLQKASKAFIQTHAVSKEPPRNLNQFPQIHTVEELEKNFIKNSKPVQKPPGPPFPHPLFHMPPRLPPGLPPLGIPPPMRHPLPLPPGLMHVIPPQFMRPPIYPTPPMHPYNFMPPQRYMPPMHRNQGYRRESNEVRDEYEGLMTPREKQWLLNIQMLQLNTGTPYFDDYYYTVFKERLKSKEEFGNDRNYRFNNRGQRTSDRQDNNTLTPRVYTPLQFENSLGKLQCGSVTAPRKIIDMDIVTPEKDAESPAVVRDTRKTKQMLLELEALYTLLLKAEDLHNPLAISNSEKLREIKQKQRLRELEQAPTHEQKQEVLRLLKLDSEPVVENQQEYILRIVNGLLQEDKFGGFLNIRKGKILLLRLLPHLGHEGFAPQLLEVWTRVLLSIPVVGRRDTAGDHILPRLYPFFKRYVQSCTMGDLLEIVAGLVEVIKQENHRSTPLSHQGRAPLYFVLLNKFGVSALVTMLIRTEYLLSSDSCSEKQHADWSNFLSSWADLTGLVTKVANPMEPIPHQIFVKHCNRFDSLTHEKRALLDKHFVDTT